MLQPEYQMTHLIFKKILLLINYSALCEKYTTTEVTARGKMPVSGVNAPLSDNLTNESK